ncbi:ferrous iron transport protein B (feoB) [Methanocaldococcus jannaschii DSM 2661]|uniref:Fe(2+) transporter FeoB n=1 Tax=Methanocaldococcus jannaschii (strain ATCC 43067 / DSM 2661 / JAL-1 / JCM 10045 / NBRC 100440) TaxID=243232 RepID=FEOB_METJA|nr:ferrous iron transport protein B [Methanocaldococcus jannaschii]Q57986.1 RecName: Full=Fe(2+) transporter FeoB; AltName: Full=Ferrous iron transport protein B [Methanocaldococcus jannaschii DSM 2661]AAB98557.1 ferrous iron transport protein B (feoB) [Methanocaldococcus jannaschii DSM 2661]
MKSYEIALIGNPNVGKSTIFNALTGENVYIGNWPGVTVEKKEGEFEYNGEKFKVVDLPGVYSLTANSIDEIIARDYIINEKPDLVVNIVDATALERNLYLTLQLMEMGANLLLALNKMDLAKSLGIEIDVDKLEKILGVKVVPLSAAKKMGIEDLKKAISIAVKDKKTAEIKYPNFEPYIKKITSILQKDEDLKKYNLRYLAIKLLENDKYVEEIVKNSKVWNELKPVLDSIINELSKKYGEAELGIVEERYKVIDKIVKEVMKKTSGKLTTTEMLDDVLTDEKIGTLLIIPFLWMLFKFTFDVSKPFSAMIEYFFGFLSEVVKSSISNKFIASLLADGIISGVGAVLVFFPILAFLFFAISFLEDSGYMARIPFITDRIMNKFGLPGKAVISMVMGFGCNVPAIMATRTIEDEKDRILTILINPLLSCSARLPIYALFAGALFSKYQGVVILSMYALGVVLALITAFLFRKLIFKTSPSYLIVELPPYHIPHLNVVLKNTWERVYDFLRKAGTIIVFGVILVWVLSVYGPSGYLGEEVFENPQLIANSWVAVIGKTLAPLFSPMGWDWRACSALVFGIIAKEVVVGSLAMLYGTGEENLSSVIAHAFSPVSAYAFMAFSLIYLPCIATLAVIKQEIGWKWALFAVTYEMILAYVVALVISVIGNLLF